MLALGKIKDIETLKSLGSYAKVKTLIKQEIGISFEVSNWDQLLKMIEQLSISVNRNTEMLVHLIADSKNLKELGLFSNAKKTISELLRLKIKARSWQQLENVLRKILLAFDNDDFKAALFEKNKMRNFINSSRLEGIHIETMPPALKMKDVLEKYRVR